MDWCSVYLTPQVLSKYIYLSPLLIFPTTSTKLGQKTARCESLRALLHYVEWDRIVTFTGAQADWGLRYCIYVQKRAGLHLISIAQKANVLKPYFVIIINRSFPHSWLVIVFLARVARRCNMWSRNCLPFRSTWVHPGFCGVHVTRSLVFCVMFCPSLFVLFPFDHYIVRHSLIYVFWLPCWYLRFTSSDYPVGILDLRLLITPLVS
jgi:hypothetical protein